MRMTQKKVDIYSTPTCHFCQMAKQFFADNKIEYTNHDVATDGNARNDMIEKSGQMGVPVTFVGEEMIIGFDEDKFREALGL
jgi:glutaredoxin-like YruB-family protein